MKLGKMLTIACQGKGWTLNKLAKEARIPPATLHGWKTGRSTANFTDLQRVSLTLGMPLHELIFGEPDPLETPAEEVLREIFSGDVRVTLHRIERKKGKRSRNEG